MTPAHPLMASNKPSLASTSTITIPYSQVHEQCSGPLRYIFGLETHMQKRTLRFIHSPIFFPPSSKFLYLFSYDRKYLTRSLSLLCSFHPLHKCLARLTPVRICCFALYVLEFVHTAYPIGYKYIANHSRYLFFLSMFYLVLQGIVLK